MQLVSPDNSVRGWIDGGMIEEKMHGLIKVGQSYAILM